MEKTENYPFTRSPAAPGGQLMADFAGVMVQGAADKGLVRRAALIVGKLWDSTEGRCV